jgi:hypothetical protein
LSNQVFRRFGQSRIGAAGDPLRAQYVPLLISSGVQHERRQIEAGNPAHSRSPAFATDRHALALQVGDVAIIPYVWRFPVSAPVDRRSPAGAIVSSAGMIWNSGRRVSSRLSKSFAG